MRITVVGASGLIGSKVVERLKADGHDVVASSRSSGVDVLTGEGLADALAGADVLVDVTNSPKLDGESAMEFFSKSTPNLVEAARQAGVRHYVALSIVGVDGMPDSGYMRGELRIPAGKHVPYKPSAEVPMLERGPGVAPGSIANTIGSAAIFWRSAGWITPGALSPKKTSAPLMTSCTLPFSLSGFVLRPYQSLTQFMRSARPS